MQRTNEQRNKWGRQDAANSVGMANPIHNNWRRPSGDLRHHDRAYVDGYIKTWKAKTGELLIVHIDHWNPYEGGTI